NKELMTLPKLEIWQNKLSSLVLNNQMDVLRADIPSLVRMKNHYGDTSVKAVLVDLIADFTESLNLGKNMSVPQIASLIQQIQQTFYYLNFADLKLFFQKMKLGAYGKFYDRMDESVILTALTEYDIERAEYVRMKDGEQKKNDFQTYHPDMLAVISKAHKEISDKMHAEKVNIRKPATPTEAELFHKRALKQFDNLFSKYGIQIGLRALKIGQTVFTIDTFIDRKINNIINSKY